MFEKNWKPLFIEELDAFLGILIVMGVNHDSKVSIEHLWSKNENFTIQFYRKVMPRDRFKQLLSALRFDDSTSRIVRQETDRLAAIREIHDIMRENCMRNYNTSESVTVDERMIGFRGNCKFRVYMKSKPDKYGIKVWVLADANNFYVKNFQIYLGKQMNIREKNQAERVVLELSSCLDSGVNITVDNFFTSISLANKLLENNMTLLGTLRTNRKGIPAEMIETKNRDEYSSKFMFTDKLQLTSYCPKKCKVVLLLSSSAPDTSEIDMSEQKSHAKIGEKKPQVILDYNRTKIGVDLFDMMAKDYPVKRKSRRWTMAVFYNFLETSLINAFIILKEKNESIIRRQQLVILAESLVAPYDQIQQNQALQSSYSDEPPAKKPRSKKCNQCPPPHKTKHYATQFCSKCHEPVCSYHFTILCDSCKNNTNQ